MSCIVCFGWGHSKSCCICLRLPMGQHHWLCGCFCWYLPSQTCFEWERDWESWIIHSGQTHQIAHSDKVTEWPLCMCVRACFCVCVWTATAHYSSSLSSSDLTFGQLPNSLHDDDIIISFYLTLRDSNYLILCMPATLVGGNCNIAVLHFNLTWKSILTESWHKGHKVPAHFNQFIRLIQWAYKIMKQQPN